MRFRYSWTTNGPLSLCVSVEAADPDKARAKLRKQFEAWSRNQPVLLDELGGEPILIFFSPYAPAADEPLWEEA